MFLLSNPPEVGNLLDLLGIEYFYIFLLFWGAILSKSSIIIFNISMGNFSLFPAQIHIFSVGSNHIFFIKSNDVPSNFIFSDISPAKKPSLEMAMMVPSWHFQVFSKHMATTKFHHQWPHHPELLKGAIVAIDELHKVVPQFVS